MFFQKIVSQAALAKASAKQTPPAERLVNAEAFTAQVTKALRDWATHYSATNDSTPLIVAYSGGLDSTVLLHGLMSLGHTPDIAFQRPLIAAYYHHNWHGSPARELPRLIKNTSLFNVPLVLCSPNLKTPHTETEARHDRYDALAQLAVAHQSSILLTAHHQDDQIETLLFRLFRGTGLDGMAGIQAIQHFDFAPSVAIHRPLLNIPRAALSAYATVHGLHFYEDPSNEDRQHSRNRIRHDVLTTIEGQFPQVRQSLLRFSALCGDSARLANDAVRVCQEQMLDQVSEVLSQEEVHIGLQEDLQTDVRLDRAMAHLPLVAFQQLAPSYQRRLLKLFLERAKVRTSFDQIDRCLRFIMGERSQAASPKAGQSSSKTLFHTGGLFSLGKSSTLADTQASPRYLAVHRGVISIVTPARYQFPGGSPPALGLPVALAASEAFLGSLQASSPVFRLTVGVECLSEELQRLHKNAAMLTDEGWSFFFNDGLLAQVAQRTSSKSRHWGSPPQLMQTFLLRTPRPGDVYQTLSGANRSFKRFLAESGLPAATRMSLPVLAFHNQIIWAQGFSQPLPSPLKAPKWLSEDHPATHRIWVRQAGNNEPPSMMAMALSSVEEPVADSKENS
ncbi:MAG: tRNA lysidine(34) synthetase TilS [Vampirovibrionales bacterium]|nr:tRNA lysidine(34) synthetase TilS [Vampirovibrionales bacterium]